MRGVQSRTPSSTGFTIVELMLVIAVIVVLASMTIVTYNGIQRRSAASMTQRTVADALKTLQMYYAFNKEYPSNIADTEYVPPLTVAVALYTNSPQIPVYHDLDSDQNAQLFLNACNGFMPITDGATEYNNECIYNGNNEHIKGVLTSNEVIFGPEINQSEFVLTCGAACTAAQNDIIDRFLQQGGTFPVTVPKHGSVLPAPAMTDAGGATAFCVQGTAAKYADIAYHAMTTSSAPEEGQCPPSELHYP